MMVTGDDVSSDVSSDESGDAQYLSFTLGDEDYGVDILRVREIKGWEVVRTLPDMPDSIKGVLDLRGVIVPIIDLRTRFNVENVEYTPTTVTIVLTVKVGEKEQVMGVVVDSVSDVLDIAVRDLKPAPNLGRRVNTRFIKGMVTFGERIVVLLDVDKLMDPEELGLIESLV
ncbi:MAG: chemotaxis protein CheW [Candidatus Polarisedimenticolaceae bacterium]|nr:chemotaxis protein CheW [Candidatus Polarisedimenticolaceae bacterium]